MRVSQILLLALFTISASGCVTYSPFVNLPSKPIGASEGEAAASLSGLVQTGGAVDTPTGMEAFARYGFTNTFSLGLRTWTEDMDFTDGTVLSGFSFDGLFNLSDSDLRNNDAVVRYGLSSRLLFLFDNRTLEAQGLILNGVAWLPKLWILKPFGAVGGGIGYDLDPGPDDREFVFIATGHAGAAVNLTDNLEARTELAFINEFNSPDTGGVRWWFVPNLSLAYRF